MPSPDWLTATIVVRDDFWSAPTLTANGPPTPMRANRAKVAGSCPVVVSSRSAPSSPSSGVMPSDSMRAESIMLA
jgi:hypothetical protein